VCAPARAAQGWLSMALGADVAPPLASPHKPAAPPSAPEPVRARAVRGLRAACQNPGAAGALFRAV
jgi:hypothetical protein